MSKQHSPDPESPADMAVKRYGPQALLLLIIFGFHRLSGYVFSMEPSITYYLLLIPNILLFYHHFLTTMSCIKRNRNEALILGLLMVTVELLSYFGFFSVIVYTTGANWAYKAGTPGSISLGYMILAGLFHILMATAFFYMISDYYTAQEGIENGELSNEIGKLQVECDMLKDRIRQQEQQHELWQQGLNQNRELETADEMLMAENRALRKKITDDAKTRLRRDMNFSLIYAALKFFKVEQDESNEELAEAVESFHAMTRYASLIHNKNVVLLELEIKQVTNLIRFYEFLNKGNSNIRIICKVNPHRYKIISLIYVSLVSKMLTRAQLNRDEYTSEILIDVRKGYLMFVIRYMPKVSTLDELKWETTRLQTRLNHFYKGNSWLGNSIDEQKYLRTSLWIKLECCELG
ncbi:hypothetical protein [Pedobacter sp. BMA]|uniref:hypothetical protein n=1 Tax=Pedobacter sp. BMA TaxID=1663685 RepID=UPI00064B434E|nr:hypothetical protein [Pedobacter sp. BMA]KLT63890.1 hypothetical protein AB669_19360 [Pedobacter sp. BMA]